MRGQRGWSLIEVLIVMTVASVAGGLLISLMISSNRIFFDQSAHISQGLSLNQTELELTDLIKASAGVAAQYPASGTPVYTTDSNTLVIKLPAISASGDVIESVYDYAVVEADPAKPEILRKQVFNDAGSFRKAENKVLSTSLKNITFIFLDDNNSPVTPALSGRVSFIVEQSSKSGFSENNSTGSGTVNIRN